jgi:F-type H+-transporting ATPase subunit b
MRINPSNRRLRLFLVSILVAALLGGVVMIAGAAEEHQSGSSFKESWLKIWEVLNFLILAFLVFKLLKEPLKNFFKSHSEQVREQYEGAKEVSLSAEREMEEMERRYQTLEEEIQKLEQAISEIGERERDKIIARARETAEHMLEKARIESDIMLRNAAMRLRREVVDVAISLTEESIRKAIDSSDQQRLVEEYLKDLKQMPSLST